MSSVRDERGFHISFDLEEDIATELEDFALLVRLGVTHEAGLFLNDVLWKHLDHFAVVAEIIQFWVDGRKQSLLGRLDFILSTLNHRRIEFDDPLENKFISTVRALSQGSLRTGLDRPIADCDRHQLELQFNGSLDSTIQVRG